VDRNISFERIDTREASRPLVAPIAGAWIETTGWASRSIASLGRPHRGGVDRNHTSARTARKDESRPFAGA